MAIFADGSHSYEVMRRFEIDEVREASQTGGTTDKNGNPREPKGPWVDWFAEMAKKTVIRRHSKTLPQSSDVFADVEAEDIAHASRSAVALLDSRPADPPAQLEDGTVVDRETGELTGPEDPPAEDRPEPETVDATATEAKETAAKPRRGRPPGSGKAKPPESADGPEAPAEAGQSTVDASANNPPAAEPPDPAPSADDDVDDLGITNDSPEKLAEHYVTRARNCELLVDLRRLEREAEMDLAQMPDHLTAIVDTEFDHARNRLANRRGDEGAD